MTEQRDTERRLLSQVKGVQGLRCDLGRRPALWLQACYTQRGGEP